MTVVRVATIDAKKWETIETRCVLASRRRVAVARHTHRGSSRGDVRDDARVARCADAALPRPLAVRHYLRQDCSKLNHLVPESALLIVLGLVVGFLLDHFWVVDIYLPPKLFFIYLLAPIALDAGYFLPNSAFFRNIGTILLYAVVGTIFNIVAIGSILCFCSPLYDWDIPAIDLFLYAALISAVDPVAVISVLYICVFGESLLNDAVTIVLFQSLEHVARNPPQNVVKALAVEALVSFPMVSTGGILIGLVWVCITALATKYSHSTPVLQPLICLVFPYLSYLIAESVHMSGILAIVTCGLLMKPYISGNLNANALVTVRYFMKTLSSTCEALIFVFLGLSTFSKNHSWDFYFTIVTLVSCLVCRFIGTYVLTYIANRKRVQKINLVDQFIMGYGGLRGAICYGLVMSLDSTSVPSKDMLVSTTVVVIVFTVFVQGATIKPLVKLLHVRKEDPTPKTVTQQIIDCSRDDMMAGVEAIVGIHGQNYWRRRLSEINMNYVQPALTRTPSTRGDRLLENYQVTSAEESRRRLLENFRV